VEPNLAGPLAPQIEKLAAKLFPEESERDLFLKSLGEAEASSQTLMWVRDLESPFPSLEKLEGQPDFVQRVPTQTQASKHPLHESGQIYCLDYSSIFAASVLLATPTRPRAILDVCAAPGGKSIFAWRALNPGVLLSNEVVIGRARALISNFKRCSITNSAVLHLRPDQLAEKLPHACDLVILDVPCSGQSLMVKGRLMTGAFASHTISGNVKRQRRILAQSSACISPGGFLAYMTCTFSRDENEGNIEWFLRKFPQFSPVAVDFLNAYQSHLADFPAYRMWPHKSPAAGAFACLLKNNEETVVSSVDFTAIRPIWKS
jgi:16S rRNA C967 or C1407 C5-methylase (RsmB/RsmF family)